MSSSKLITIIVAYLHLHMLQVCATIKFRPSYN